QAGQICCDGTCASAGLQCNAGNTCESCGGVNEPCCGGQCSGTLVCSQNACQVCGVDQGPCCSGNTCTGTLDCVGGTCSDACGSPNQACCAGANPCDGGMDCASNVCKGLCEVRCKKGEYM